MKFIKYLLCVTVLLPFTTYANPASDQLANLLQSTQTVSANFTQTVFDGSGRVINKSTGQFCLQKPNKFRWQVNSPIKQFVISDGTQLWNYQPDLEQVTVQAVSTGVQATPLAILGGSTKALTTNFTITEQAGDSYQLVAKEKGNFTKVLLMFNGSAIKQMDLYDTMGQKTELTFANIQTNASIAAKQFQFTPPKGVDVIDGFAN
tara:strand:+ start:1346 stop:1960 length:615 start_codon:yes stop_codon:yes gene_type:complete